MIPTPARPTQSRSLRLWPTWTAVAAVWAFSLSNQIWLFALLFLAWAAFDIVTGESSFVQRVTRRDQPGTYWLVVSTWVVLSVLWLAYPG